MLVDNDYPAIGTHGDNFEGRIYALGGMSKTAFGDATIQTMVETLPADLLHVPNCVQRRNEYQLRALALTSMVCGRARTRFGPKANARTQNPVTYPFDSVGGTSNSATNSVRTLDFNTRGMVHPVVPELIEDAKIGGASDADLDLCSVPPRPIFDVEKAERRSSEMQSE